MPTARGAPSGRKKRVYTAITGINAQASRSALCGLVRNSHSVEAALGRPRDLKCGYSLRSLSFDATGGERPDMEHVVECQMAGHVLTYAPSWASIIRQIDADGSLKKQPIVVQNALAPIIKTHNSGLNLTWATHNVNMKKKSACESGLRSLDTGRELDDTLENLLTRYISQGEGKRDEAEASKLAAAITRKLRDVEPSYEADLRGVTAEASVGTVSERAQRERMYDELADELSALYGALHL
jgi:hypothetical protein